MKFYRYDMFITGGYSFDGNGDIITSKGDVRFTHNFSMLLSEYDLIKETNKGYWIDVFGCKKFVLKQSLKKFAYLTKEEALQNYISRTKASIKINKRKLELAQASLETAERFKITDGSHNNTLISIK